VISSLRGTVQRVGPGEIVVEVGGVGFSVAVPATVLEESPEAGQSISLYTRLIVRADSLSLYGFGSSEQRQLFDMLLQVNGVGPRLAMAVLSHLSPELLRSAVGTGQADILTRVPGIGRKTADKIIFHLKDRMVVAPLAQVPAPTAVDTEVLQVLTALGYSLVEAQAGVQSIPVGTAQDVEERVRMALKYFSRP
jgi:Holliday junction DNA helicase RuvA